MNLLLRLNEEQAFRTEANGSLPLSEYRAATVCGDINTPRCAVVEKRKSL